MRILRWTLAFATLLLVAACGGFLGHGLDVRANALGDSLTAVGQVQIVSCHRDASTLWTTFACEGDVRWDKRYDGVGGAGRNVTVFSGAPLTGTVSVEGHNQKNTEVVTPADRPHSTEWRFVAGLLLGTVLGMVAGGMVAPQLSTTESP